MMRTQFDEDGAKEYLLQKEERERERLEKLRKESLEKTIVILKEFFKDEPVEVYLIGSILHPYQFRDGSDLDIVVKNLQRNRFDIIAELEKKIGRTIELIPYERCHFQEYVIEKGFRVV